MEKPAIEGGNSIRNDFLPISKPTIEKEEIDAVVEVLKSGWLTTGPKVKEFEENISKYTNAKHSIAFTSCTGALHSALSSYNIKENDEVIVPTFTFVASSHVVTWLNAKPVLVDIDYETGNIDVNEIRKKITKPIRIIIIDFCFCII